MKTLLQALFLTFISIVQARPEIVTLSINFTPTNGPVVLTNTLTVTSNQTAELISWCSEGGAFAFYISKSERSYEFYASPFYGPDLNWRDLTPVAGPATITLYQCSTNPPPGNSTTHFTFRLTPEGFSPEKAVLVPPGTLGTMVRLECSTNLENWVEITNGIQQPLPIARFFRVSLDRTGFTPPAPQPGTVASESCVQTTTLCIGGPSGASDELTIGPYQTAEIVALYLPAADLRMRRGTSVTWLNGPYSTPVQWFRFWSPIRGPATFTLSPKSGTGQGYCTIRVSSEVFPPDKTLTVLPGTNSCSVTLESSTDLAAWSVATNGIYTTPVATFFRIRMETTINDSP